MPIQIAFDFQSAAAEDNLKDAKVSKTLPVISCDKSFVMILTSFLRILEG
jgi:hypothetical protein